MQRTSLGLSTRSDKPPADRLLLFIQRAQLAIYYDEKFSRSHAERDLPSRREMALDDER